MGKQPYFALNQEEFFDMETRDAAIQDELSLLRDALAAAEARAQAAEAELVQVKAAKAGQDAWSAGLRRQLSAAEARAVALTDALQKYGAHIGDCWITPKGVGPHPDRGDPDQMTCTCGLRAARQSTSLADMPPDELRWRLENREEME